MAGESFTFELTQLACAYERNRHTLCTYTCCDHGGPGGSCVRICVWCMVLILGSDTCSLICLCHCCYTFGFLFSLFLFLLFASVLSSRALHSLRLVVLSKCIFCGAPTVYTMGMHFCRLSNLYRLHIHIVYSSHPTKLVHKVLH